MAEYECKYKQIFDKDSKCNIFNDAHFSGPVTINAGGKINTTDDNKVKEAIETLFVEKIATNDNQWYAIKRVLCDKNIAPQKLDDFLTYIDGLHLEGVPEYVNNNVKMVGQRYTRLSVKVDAWKDLVNPTEAEQRQIIVAVRLMEILFS